MGINRQNGSEMVQNGPIWSNMVQNQPKKCPKGSGTTRSPGLVNNEINLKKKKSIVHVALGRKLTAFS